MFKSRKAFILIGIVLLAAVGAGFYWFAHRNLESTDDAAIEGHAIPVAAKVSGYVTTLAIADNQHVKAGDLLLRIDSRDYDIALRQAQADLDIARAKLIAGQHNFASTSVSAPSNLESAQAQVNAAMAEWKNAQATLNRLQKLNDAARSRQSLDNAVAAEKSAHSTYENAQAQLRSANTAPDAIAASEAGVTELQASVAKAQAALDQAQVDLGNTKILAPSNGVITRRTVENGAYIQPGQQLLTLVGDDVWVTANFKETQIGRMKPGQKVDIEVDSYKNAEYEGKIDSIQSGTGSRFSLFPAENATGNFVKIVQRVPVKIVFTKLPDDAPRIGPGMSVVPTVHIQ